MTTPDEFETLEAYWSDAEAQLNKNLLESVGIPCFLLGETTSRALWYLSNATGGIRLQVARSNLDRAEAILQEARSREGASTDAAEWNSAQAESQQAPAEERNPDDHLPDDASDSQATDRPTGDETEAYENDDERDLAEEGGGLLSELRSVRRLILAPLLVGPILAVVVAAIVVLGIIVSFVMRLASAS